MQIRKLVAVVALCLVAAIVASAQTIQFKDFKLRNGLRVILSEDHSAPTYSLVMTYNVGSRDERPGRTGFAHLFEHMMFEGSENVGKGEHGLSIINSGGTRNGTTNSDRTNYFETLPSNQIDLGLFLESDRMRSLVINQVNFENQRNVVQEERRRSYDNQPYGKTSEAILDTVYDSFPYKHSTIGSMEDLNAAKIEDVAAFFKTYYAPNNAVLTMVGDFKVDEVTAKIEKYFGSIPAQPAPPLVDMVEPKQSAERRRTVQDPLALVPRLSIVFKIPQGNTPDWYTLLVAGQVLSGGESSRLYQRLVKESQVATAVGAAAQDRRGPSTFTITVDLQRGKNPADAEKLIYEELEKLKNEPVTNAELEEFRIALRRNEVEQLVGTLTRAQNLGTLAVYYDDPGLINTRGQKLRTVTREQIQKTARTYFIETNRTVVLTTPVSQTPGTGGGR